MNEWRVENLHPQTLKRMRAATGVIMEKDAWQTEQSRRNKCDRLTALIVERLSHFGIDLQSRDQLSLLDIVAQCGRLLPLVKHQVFLPAVARMERQKLIRDFKKWSEEREHQLRYFVFTSGTRCRISAMGARFKWLHRKLSDFLQRDEFAPGGIWEGVEAAVRSDEFTMVRGADWFLSCHPHMNVIMRFPKKLGSEGYRNFMLALHDHFESHLSDSGRVTEVREVIKYLCKYERGDDAGKVCEPHTLGLADVEPQELKELYEARRTLKPVQRLGSFAVWCKELKGKRLKTVYERRGERLKLVIAPMDPARERTEKSPLQLYLDKDLNEKDVLMTVTAPQSSLTTVARPCVLVKNFSGDYDALLSKYPGLRELTDHIQRWEAQQEIYRLSVRDARARNSKFNNSTETPGSDPPGERRFPPGSIPCGRSGRNGNGPGRPLSRREMLLEESSAESFVVGPADEFAADFARRVAGGLESTETAKLICA